MYFPVAKCQNVSESATSVEKQAIRRIAASARIAGLSLVGAGVIVRRPLCGPPLFADQRVKIGHAAGAAGMLGIVFDLLLALRLDALECLQAIERLHPGGRLAHEYNTPIVGLHQFPFRLFGVGKSRRQGVYAAVEAVKTV